MKLFVLLLLFYSSVSSCAAEKRIIQGEDATVGQFPFYAQTIIMGQKIWCGATIIHERWLLSAAHCFQKPLANLSITVGTNKNFLVSGQRYLVEKVINHENYRNILNVSYNDIALIRLKSDIRFSTNVQLIKLPKNNSTKFDGASVTITGMGRTSTSVNNKPSILQYIRAKVLPLELCRPYRPVDFSEDAKLCTWGTNGKSGCRGDSGGPVVTNGLLIGIVSSGELHCLPSKPNVHTRVSSYLDWIKNTMNIYSDLLL